MNGHYLLQFNCTGWATKGIGFNRYNTLIKLVKFNFKFYSYYFLYVIFCVLYVITIN